MPTIKISEAEWQQLTCDIECAIEELEELSSEVDWYVTDLPSRLQTALEILTPEEEAP